MLADEVYEGERVFRVVQIEAGAAQVDQTTIGRCVLNCFGLDPCPEGQAAVALYYSEGSMKPKGYPADFYDINCLEDRIEFKVHHSRYEDIVHGISEIVNFPLSINKIE